jgi:hypothetical protein
LRTPSQANVPGANPWSATDERLRAAGQRGNFVRFDPTAAFRQSRAIDRDLLESQPQFTFPELMHPSLSLRARSAVLAAMAVTLSACDDHGNPNAPSSRLGPQDVQTQLAASESFAIANLTLSSKTVVIDGPLVTYTATIFSSTKSFKGLTVRAYLVQQQVRHAVGDQGVPCGFGSSTCTYTNPLQTSGVVPGSAQFELQLLNASGVVSTSDVGVTLVAPQTISALTLGSTNLVLGGPDTSFSATLQNFGPPISGAAIQGWLVQSGTNNARRAAGGSVVQCGSGSGVLPNGACTLSSSIVASNAGAGTGTLIPGPAMFELDLTVNGIVRAETTMVVSIRAGATITGLTLGAMTSDTLLLEGSSARFTATLQNPGSSLSGISIQGFVTQGTARRFAGGALISCGSGAGVLPSGSCTVASQLAASNNTAGSGTLVTGGATFELQLVDAIGTVLGTANIPLYVIDGPLESGPPSSNTDRIVGTKRGRVRTP